MDREGEEEAKAKEEEDGAHSEQLKKGEGGARKREAGVVPT